MAVGGFTLTIADPPACTVGFLPPSQWRSPADVSEADTPDNLYCKLPQDSPISVGGARNYPCMGKPGKRAPTVEICNSDKEYVPLAERQHGLGQIDTTSQRPRGGHNRFARGALGSAPFVAGAHDAAEGDQDWRWVARQR